MNWHRISVKYFVDDPRGVDLAAIIPIFHQWIQEARVPGMLIDVADYQHMVDGPGVVLIGDGVDYALDMTRSRPGLLHTAKRIGSKDSRASLVGAFRSALLACQALEREKTLAGKLRFRTGEAQLIVADRLRAENTDATFQSVLGEVAGVVEELYGSAGATIERDTEDDRRPLTIRIRAEVEPDLSTLIERLSEQFSRAG